MPFIANHLGAKLIDGRFPEGDGEIVVDEHIMKNNDMNDYNYVEENERILKEWCKKFVEDKKQDKEYRGYDIEKYFAKDGIMNIGDKFTMDKNGTIWREASGEENTKWNECPMRILFLTKDENTDGNEAWDVREETFYAKRYGLPPQNNTISGSFFTKMKLVFCMDY